jgi:two-component system, NarL family, invasion response regulator UvrY
MMDVDENESLTFAGSASGDRQRSVIIADDHRLVSEGMARFLETTPDFKVVQICTDGDELSGTLSVICPDLLLLDIDMPGLSVLSFLRNISRRQPAPAVLVISGLSPEIYAARVVEAGAMGFLSKDVSPSVLLTAMRCVCAGQLWIHRDHATGPGRELSITEGTARGGLATLSARELEVFHLLAKGKPASEVGPLLYISPRTVASHRVRIYRKLGVSSPGELMRLASEIKRMEGPPDA